MPEFFSDKVLLHEGKKNAEINQICIYNSGAKYKYIHLCFPIHYGWNAWLETVDPNNSSCHHEQQQQQQQKCWLSPQWASALMLEVIWAALPLVPEALACWKGGLREAGHKNIPSLAYTQGFPQPLCIHYDCFLQLIHRYSPAQAGQRECVQQSALLQKPVSMDQ